MGRQCGHSSNHLLLCLRRATSPRKRSQFAHTSVRGVMMCTSVHSVSKSYESWYIPECAEAHIPAKQKHTTCAYPFFYG